MSPRNSSRLQTRGFTLIEILVVVAIIALLVAILLPSLKNARELSKGTVCGTRMSQTFKGTLMYAHANQDRLPYYGWMSGRPLGSEWWPTQIARLVGNQYEIYLCPTDLQPFQLDVVYEKGTIRMPKVGDQTTVPLMLTWRSACDTLMDVGGTYVPRKLSSWRHPGSGILLVEAPAKISGTSGSGNFECFRFRENLRVMVDPAVLLKQPELLTPWKRHVGKSNLLFVDGHVDRLFPERVSRLADHQESYLAGGGS
jgi:prepilin-type N-terminal cleavage/methylation domain-containing protein/prepilin-type processing-associated H-X9-DG protein